MKRLAWVDIVLVVWVVIGVAVMLSADALAGSAVKADGTRRFFSIGSSADYDASDDVALTTEYQEIEVTDGNGAAFAIGEICVWNFETSGSGMISVSMDGVTTLFVVPINYAWCEDDIASPPSPTSFYIRGESGGESYFARAK